MKTYVQPESTARELGNSHMEVCCYWVLAILINIPLPASSGKSWHQNQVQYLLLASFILARLKHSPTICFTSSVVSLSSHSADAVLVVISSVLIYKLIWIRVLTLQSLYGLQQMYHRNRCCPQPCHHISALGSVVASKEDFQISSAKIAWASSNNLRHRYWPLITFTKVKPVLPLQMPFSQSLHDVIIKMNSRWKPAIQILGGSVNFRPNLTVCWQAVFLTQHLSLFQFLKQKRETFCFEQCKAGLCLGLDMLSSYHGSSRNHSNSIMCLSSKRRLKSKVWIQVEERMDVFSFRTHSFPWYMCKSLLLLLVIRKK